MKVKEESEEAGSILNIQKTKIITSSPTTSWQIEMQKVEAVKVFFSWAQNQGRWWMQPQN